MSISTRYRPGVLAVSPPDEFEMPDEYIDQARADLLTDSGWIADRIAEAVDGVIADLLIAGAVDQQVRDVVLCNRLRAAVNAAVEREVPGLAESLWTRDIESSEQDADDDTDAADRASDFAYDCAREDRFFGR